MELWSLRKGPSVRLRPRYCNNSKSSGGPSLASSDYTYQLAYWRSAAICLSLVLRVGSVLYQCSACSLCTKL